MSKLVKIKAVPKPRPQHRPQTEFHNRAITLSLGEFAENHVGMQKIGTAAKEGFTLDYLLQLQEMFILQGYRTEILNLHDYLPAEYHGYKGVEADKGHVLILRNAVRYADINADDLFKEQQGLAYDTKAYMKGRVVNKRARYNLCFDNEGQKADYENRKGTVISYDEVPLLKKLRDALSKIVEDAGYPSLKVESNYYYDTRKTGIGYHGDVERKLVIGVRLGTVVPLVYQWYHETRAVSEIIPVALDHGDIYLMSYKASGNDWRKRSNVTLRHAAGCSKYTHLP